jgi:Domain of unknown function (DUF5666)
MTDPIGAPDVVGAPSTIEPTFSRRLAGPSVLRIGVVVLAALALLATAALAIGASPSPSTGANDPSTVLPPAAGAFGGSLGGGPADFGRLGGGRGGFGTITITSVDGANLALKTADGWTRTIATTADTQITKGGKTIAVGDLKSGDEVVFGQKKNDDGTYSITAVRVILPVVGGTVTGVTGSTITVKQRDGSSATIDVNSGTTYKVAGVTTASLTDVKVGMYLSAEGTKSSSGNLTASQVRAFAFGIDGFGGGRHGFGLPGTPKNANPSASPTTNG